MVADVKLVEYRKVGRKIVPLIFESDDRDRAVPLKSGKRAAMAAEYISESMKEVAEDYHVEDSVMFAPYRINFSYSPLPMYKGLDRDGIDMVKLPCYMVTRKVSKHEGSHMAHRRLLEQKLILNGSEDPRKGSEDMLRKKAKWNFPVVERFANSYSDLDKTYVVAGTAGSAVCAGAIGAVASGDISAIGAASLPFLAYGLYINIRMLASYFQPMSSVTEV